jgi:hypothetical protein
VENWGNWKTRMGCRGQVAPGLPFGVLGMDPRAGCMLAKPLPLSRTQPCSQLQLCTSTFDFTVQSGR